MNVTIEIGTILTSLLSGLALYGIVSILKQLRLMNGRIGKIETWQTDHEKIDDDRIGALRSSLREVWEAIDKIRETFFTRS